MAARGARAEATATVRIDIPRCSHASTAKVVYPTSDRDWADVEAVGAGYTFQKQFGKTTRMHDADFCSEQAPPEE